MMRDYDPTLGRYIESDRIGLAGGLNLFSYAGQNPAQEIDPYGLDTYIVNRDLAFAGSSSESRLDPLTHTFALTTNPDGSISHTYSWGNAANQKGWNLDQPLDLTTGAQSLKNLQAEWVGGPSLDPYVAQAFGYLNNPQFSHQNGYLTNNCKTETDNLLDVAEALQSATDAYQNFQSSIINNLQNYGN
jgi:uncharacterized protein RhaS with RHS repeats